MNGKKAARSAKKELQRATTKYNKIACADNVTHAHLHNNDVNIMPLSFSQYFAGS